MSKNVKDFKLYAKYKWEFLRRNPQYLKEYHDLINTNIDFDEIDWAHPWRSNNPEYFIFCEKWVLSEPLPPNYSYDDLTINIEKTSQCIRSDYKQSDLKKSPVAEYETEYISYLKLVFSRDIDLHEHMYGLLFPSYYTKKPAKLKRLIYAKISDGEDWSVGFRNVDDSNWSCIKIDPKFTKSGEIEITVNVNYPKKRIMNEVEFIVDEYQELYRRNLRNVEPSDNNELPKQESQKEKRYHFDNFDLYLEVYDFRLNSVSWASIKNQLGLNSVQTARNYWNAACSMIEKGISPYVEQP